jgi:hypothetical protein
VDPVWTPPPHYANKKKSQFLGTYLVGMYCIHTYITMEIKMQRVTSSTEIPMLHCRIKGARSPYNVKHIINYNSEILYFCCPDANFIFINFVTRTLNRIISAVNSDSGPLSNCYKNKSLHLHLYSGIIFVTHIN